jgi:hypothetical protein
MPTPHDYAERVYAGVLGKIIGVYLGRPFEGWPYEHIEQGACATRVVRGCAAGLWDNIT